MTKYREIIRLASLNLSQTNIALSCGVSKKTVNKVLKAAREKGISWPLDPKQTDAVHTALAGGSWCGTERQRGGGSGSVLM